MAAGPARRRVLFVCMGNICRSPTAEGVLRARLAVAGLGDHVEVDSAGTHGYHAGEAPDRRAQSHAKKRGYDLSGLRARRIVEGDLMRFDHVLAMDEDNLEVLRSLAPAGATAKIQLVLTYARRHRGTLEVPDPYYGPPAGFERVLDLLEDACDGLVESLRAELAASAP